MSNYANGRKDEYKVRDALTADGYDVIRSAGSKGAVDLVAFKSWPIGPDVIRVTPWDTATHFHALLFVQVKRGKPAPIPPAERAELLRVAELGRATPVVAYLEPRKPIVYRRLTGPGAKDSTPWTPDQVGAA